MVVGKITLQTEYGDAEIPVEVLGKGPRPGTAWVRALNGLEPFTKMSHGGSLSGRHQCGFDSLAAGSTYRSGSE